MGCNMYHYGFNHVFSITHCWLSAWLKGNARRELYGSAPEYFYIDAMRRHSNPFLHLAPVMVII